MIFQNRFLILKYLILVMNTNTYWHFYTHCRVNMEDTTVVSNYEGKGIDCYVTAKEENIRPYGILFKEV